MLDDGKLMTPTCYDMGFREIPRCEYLNHLAQAVHRADKKSRWRVEANASADADWRPGYGSVPGVIENRP